MAKKIGGLGKGLSAIFSENDTEDKNEVVTLKISQVEPNRKQPRRALTTSRSENWRRASVSTAFYSRS